MISGPGVMVACTCISGLILHSNPSWVHSGAAGVLREGDIALVVSVIEDDDGDPWYCLMGEHGIGWATNGHILDVERGGDYLVSMRHARKRRASA